MAFSIEQAGSEGAMSPAASPEVKEPPQDGQEKARPSGMSKQSTVRW